MKTFRPGVGPFSERPYFEIHEIERICSEELEAVGLFPSVPEAVRVERFIEKRFGISPSYDELPEGVLGVTKFGHEGVEAIIVSRTVDEEGTRATQRRVNTTLAHEAGHGLLHAHLFVLETNRSLFGEDADPTRILCRGDSIPTVGRPAQRVYDGRWWEFQANQAMGALLLPRKLVDRSLEPFLMRQGALGRSTLPAARREEAVRLLADVFDVNPIVARIRLGELYAEAEETQLTL